MPGQITIEDLAVLQVIIIPLMGALWWSLNRRLDRLETKIDAHPSADVCNTRYDALKDRLVKLEVP